jgi:phage-related protein (TIGR01555 family)
MSGRIVNVRPKAGFVLDHAGSVVPGNVVPIRDNLMNAMSGMGTGRDVRASSFYGARPLTKYKIAAAYSGSGMMRKILQIPALDMVREWRDWEGLDDDQAALIYDEEKRLGLRQKVRQAEVLRGMGGGALILGLPGGDLSQPAPKTVSKGGLAFVHVVSRWHLTFDELQNDATQDGYGEPVMWKLNSVGAQQSIHPSRIVPFRADTTASLAMPNTWGMHEAFWGESTVQQVLDAVKDNDTARASFAALIHKARLLRIGIPGLMDTIASGGTANVQARLAAIVMAESIHNATIYDAGNDEGKGGEEIGDATYNFAGAKDIFEAYSQFVSAVSDIPMTRMHGRSAGGLNSSGDSEQKDWNKKVRAQQTLDLAPCLDRVDRYLVPSATGKTIATASYDWAPLDTPTEKEEAETFFAVMQGLEKLQASATVPDPALARGVQSYLVAQGLFPELEAALAEIPDDQRFGILADPNADPAELDPNAAEGGDPNLAGQGGAQEKSPPRRAGAANDAAPRSLYVQRKLLNATDVIKWAKGQGFDTTLDAGDMHVTVLFSRQPVDWMKMGSPWSDDDKGNLTVPPGGARIVEPLGDKGAVVLLFNSSSLAYRHEDMVRNGASHDFEDYQPHVTITYAKPEGLDLAAVEPYRGELRFGPELFSELDEDWAANVEEA